MECMLERELERERLALMSASAAVVSPATTSSREILPPPLEFES